jgi:Na+-translocating ferredoxin:NAD+ oxidoreductase subunit E
MPSTTDPIRIAREGLWENNPGLRQLLGLCPLLAISNTATNALGLGIATVFVLAFSNLVVSLGRPFLKPEIRIPFFVLVIASAVTAVELLMNAFVHDLYRVLGLFIPLIVTNCMILGRAEAYASRQPPLKATLDGVFMGFGFLWALLAIGGLRELWGQGTLFAHAGTLFGPGFAWMEFTLIPGYRGFLLAILPAGAFFVLALLVAMKQWIDLRFAARALPREATA